VAAPLKDLACEAVRSSAALVPEVHIGRGTHSDPGTDASGMSPPQPVHRLVPKGSVHPQPWDVTAPGLSCCRLGGADIATAR
jgi:hypothetical protein